MLNIDPTDPIAERATVAAVWRDWLPGALAEQVRRDGDPNDGGFIAHGWCDGRHAAFRLSQLIAARWWADEIAADVARLDDAIRRAVHFIRRRQHPDGRMDLSGFYSPNEVGFTLPVLAAGYRRLQRLPGLPLADITEELARYLTLGAEAVLAGTAYTANHRWAAACAPLAAMHALWPDARYLAKIEDYLADGIDCDADGCWNVERSPNYNTVANHGLLVMADCLGRPELRAHVVRNLEFLLHNLQPNGEADATYSHRQDRLLADRLVSDYAVARRVALLTGDGRFTTLARQMWTQTGGRPNEFAPAPYQLDDFPGPLPAPQPLPTRYEKIFAGIGVARIRDGERAVTIACDHGGHFFDATRDQWGGQRHSDDWLHLHAGDIVIETVRVSGSGMTHIQPRTLTQTAPGAYALTAFGKGWSHPLHFRPGWPKVEFNWNWSSEIALEITERELAVQIASAAPDALRAQLWLWVRPGVQLIDGDADPITLTAGAQLHLHGGAPILLRSNTTEVTITGLPPSAHQCVMLPTESIPSSVTRDCAGLALGLLFPVALALRIGFRARLSTD